MSAATNMLAKLRRQARRPARPLICGEPHPDLGERVGFRGDVLTAVVCTARVHHEWDEKKRQEVLRHHRGDHRARTVQGVLLRWTNKRADR